MRAVLPVALSAVLVAACGPAPSTAAGYVIDVQSTSVTQIDEFTIRTDAGETVRFRVGALELDGGAFPAGHLREHMALGQPVAIGYRDDAGVLVAYRLVDAPWLQ